MDATLIVLLVLGLVAATALVYEPPALYGGWRRLSEAFGTERHASRYELPAQRLMLGSMMDLSEYGAFDVATDKEGLWLHYVGPNPRKCCEHMLIPWDRIRLRPARNGYAGEEIEVLADKPVRLVVPSAIVHQAAQKLGVQLQKDG